jgi:hypothetical protein
VTTASLADSPDQALAERLKAAIERKEFGLARLFRSHELASRRLMARATYQEIADTTRFILLRGQSDMRLQ